MVVSEKRRVANRANARKSTGPRTEAGKAISSQNAIVHGLTATAVVLPGESLEGYQVFAQIMLEDLRPRTQMQWIIACRIVELSWKIQRIAQAEAQRFQQRQREDELCSIGKILAGECGSGEEYGYLRIQKYEQRMERMLHANLRQLQQLKKSQAEEPPAEPLIEQNEAIVEPTEELTPDDNEKKEDAVEVTEENDKTKPLLEEELIETEPLSAFRASFLTDTSPVVVPTGSS